MIQIRRDNLEELANIHYKAIIKYFTERSTIKIADINSSIKSCFGDDWNFEKLIKAKPKDLEILTKIYKFKCCSTPLNFETYYGYLNNYKEIKFVTDDEKPYTAYTLIKSLDINTCPYCNRNTIYNLRYATKRTSELDHFHHISKYPFLGISFYNLIPSCKVCNKIKLDKEKEYINPYDERFNFNKNFNFKFTPLKSNFYTNPDSIQLIFANSAINKEESKRISNNLEVFELEDLYQNHKDIVVELIQKEYIYNDSYIDEIFKNYEGRLFKNREDVLRSITCGYVEDKDLDKRPLSKLIKDISEELGLH